MTRRTLRVLLPTVVVAGALFGSVARGSSAEPQQPAADLVENYSYPGAGALQQATGVKLISGDGHLMMVDCTTAGALIKVYSLPVDACFRVAGSGGRLVLEMPDIYLIKGDSHAVTATITSDGETETVTVPRDGYVGVGIGTSPDSPSAVLLELVASA
jgi:hypothetical protein